MELVAGRQCGECTVCCTTLHIDTTEFQKAPGIRCPHLRIEGGGCSIYEERPTACRAYNCGWRYLGFLSDSWRPDRSGVLLAFTPPDELPGGYQTGVSLILVARPPSSFTRALYHYVAHLIADGVHVMLAVPGPPGEYPSVAMLNDELRGAPKNDQSRLEAIFAEAFALDKTPSPRFKRVIRGSP